MVLHGGKLVSRGGSDRINRINRIGALRGKAESEKARKAETNTALGLPRRGGAD